MKKLISNFAIKSRKGERKTNQDCLVCSYNHNEELCVVVSDGMGSVEHSEIAAKIICDVFVTSFERTKNILADPRPWFNKTLDYALKRIKEIATVKDIKGISATLALLLITRDKFYAFNIGDTRIYAINKEAIKQYSYDHNYLNYLISKGKTKKEIEEAKKRWFALTNFVDGENPQCARYNLEIGETKKFNYFLVCTDGLYNYVSDAQKMKIINKKGCPLVLKSTLLNSKALSNHSKDNVSNVLVKIKVK